MDQDFRDTVAAMIEEQGEAWLAVDEFPDRGDELNAVVLTDGPQRCFRLVFRDGKWLTLEGNMSSSELAEFFAAFGSHWALTLHSWVETSGLLVPIRAFIKNGRRKSGFSISLDLTRSYEQKAA